MPCTEISFEVVRLGPLVQFKALLLYEAVASSLAETVVLVTIPDLSTRPLAIGEELPAP